MTPLEKVQYMASLARDESLTDSAVRVGVYLCDCENGKTGQCNPATASIASDTNLSLRAVKYALKALEERGHIVVVKRGNGKGNKSEYAIRKGAKDAPLKGARNAPLSKPKGAKNDSQRVQKTTAKGAKNDNPPFTPLISEPVKEPVKGTSEVCNGVEKSTRAAPQKVTPPPSAETWSAYAAAYESRYGVLPVRNQQVNSQLSAFVKRLGHDEAPKVAAYYVASNNGFYVRAGHATGPMLKDAEKLRMEWATGRQVTQAAATQIDRTQTNASAASEALDILNRRGRAHG